jgi:hypothetical protein
MTPSEARNAARQIATGIASGDVDPYEGAMRIWKEVLDQLDGRIPDDLWSFKSNASAIEDCLWHAGDTGSNHDVLVNQCRDEIVQAARVLRESADEQ